MLFFFFFFFRYLDIKFFFFFFQAEDGIRDYKVTGVQTCALPISLFNAGLERCYLNGGNPEQVYVSPGVKRVISSFTATNQNRNIAAVDKKLVAALDLYDTDFGIIQVVMDRWIPQATNTVTATAASDIIGNVFFLERSKNRLAWLRPVMHTLVGKNGDAVRGSVLGETTLEVLNPLADFVLTQVNNI